MIPRETGHRPSGLSFPPEPHLESAISLCGQTLGLHLDPTARDFLPTQLPIMEALTDSDVAVIFEKALQSEAPVIKEALGLFLAGSLVLDVSVLSRKPLYELHLTAGLLSSLEALRCESSGQPLVDLAAGLLISALIVDNQSPCTNANKQGHLLRKSFKGQVILRLHEHLTAGEITPDTQESVRSKLKDCARSNSQLAAGVADLLTSWEQIADYAESDSARRTEEFFPED